MLLIPVFDITIRNIDVYESIYVETMQKPLNKKNIFWTWNIQRVVISE